MEIRKITDNERSAVNRLHNYVYGQWEDGQVKEENLAYILPEETYGVFDETGELVSTFSVLALQQSIRGVLKGMGGIAMAGTYPEARYKGFIRDMTAIAFADMKANGLAYSALTPFRDSFYARFGYVTANTHMRVKAPLHCLRYALEEHIEGDWEVVRVRAASAKDDFLTFVWEVAPSRHHGFVLYPTISDAEWNRRNKDRLIVFVKNHGQIEAIARYQIKGFGYGLLGPEGELLVDEMYWRTLDARTKLFNFFAKHIDQIAHITMNLPFGVNFQQWFVDPMVNIEIKIWTPWVVRIIDVETALEGLPAEGVGEITFTLADRHCDWNNGIFSLQADAGKLTIRRSTVNPTIKMTIEALSALVYGTLSLEEIEYKGWIEFMDSQEKQTLNRWFPPLPIYSAFGY